MRRREREEDPGLSFDGGYHLYAKEKHKERVGKNADRIQYAIKQFEMNNIEYTLKNAQCGHFHCRRKSDDELFQFWSGTGKILGYDKLRGIHSLIKLLLRKDDEHGIYKKFSKSAKSQNHSNISGYFSFCGSITQWCYQF